MDPALIRVLPQSRLQTVESDALIAAVAKLQPGDVKLSLESRTRQSSSTTELNRLVLATPVFDERSGKVFGMVVVETDYAGRIMEAMQGLSFVDCEIFITDGSGNLFVWANTKSGVQPATPGQTIPDLPTVVSNRLTKKGEPFRISNPNEYVASRYYLDPAGRGVMIFARLPKGE